MIASSNKKTNAAKTHVAAIRRRPSINIAYAANSNASSSKNQRGSSKNLMYQKIMAVTAQSSSQIAANRERWFHKKKKWFQQKSKEVPAKSVHRNQMGMVAKKKRVVAKQIGGSSKKITWFQHKLVATVVDSSLAMATN